MIDIKSIQTGGTCLESSETKEKYTTRVTDHTFAWKDMWWEAQLSHDDLEKQDVPIDNITLDIAGKVESMSTSIVALNISLHNKSSTDPMTELPGIDAASVSDSACGTEIMQMSTVSPNEP